MSRLNELWQQIAEYGRNLQNVPLSEIQGKLSGFKDQIMEIVQNDPSATPGRGPVGLADRHRASGPRRRGHPARPPHRRRPLPPGTTPATAPGRPLRPAHRRHAASPAPWVRRHGRGTGTRPPGGATRQPAPGTPSAAPTETAPPD